MYPLRFRKRVKIGSCSGGSASLCMPARAAALHSAHHSQATSHHLADSKLKGAGKKKRKVGFQDDHWTPSHYPATPGAHAIKNTAQVHLRCCRGHNDWQRRAVITTSDFLALMLPEAGSRVRVSTLTACCRVSVESSLYRFTRSSLTCMPLLTGCNTSGRH